MERPPPSGSVDNDSSLVTGNSGEATLHILHGHVPLVSGGDAQKGRRGDLLIAQRLRTAPKHSMTPPCCSPWRNGATAAPERSRQSVSSDIRWR
jgi:hypothetical protein